MIILVSVEKFYVRGNTRELIRTLCDKEFDDVTFECSLTKNEINEILIRTDYAKALLLICCRYFRMIPFCGKLQLQQDLF